MRVLTRTVCVRLTEAQFRSYNRLLRNFHVYGSSKSDDFRNLLVKVDEWFYNNHLKCGVDVDSFDPPRVSVVEEEA